MLTALAPLASAGLLLLCFPPFELYITPFVALVPLIYLIDRSADKWRAAAGTFLFAMAFWLGPALLDYTVYQGRVPGHFTDIEYCDGRLCVHG